MAGELFREALREDIEVFPAMEFHPQTRQQRDWLQAVSRELQAGFSENGDSFILILNPKSLAGKEVSRRWADFLAGRAASHRHLVAAFLRVALSQAWAEAASAIVLQAVGLRPERATWRQQQNADIWLEQNFSHTCPLADLRAIAQAEAAKLRPLIRQAEVAHGRRGCR